MWSCRIHSGLWGGDMYWCRGKTNKEALGCKVNKHESKDEESDDEAKESDSSSMVVDVDCDNEEPDNEDKKPSANDGKVTSDEIVTRDNKLSSKHVTISRAQQTRDNKLNTTTA